MPKRCSCGIIIDGLIKVNSHRRGLRQSLCKNDNWSALTVERRSRLRWKNRNFSPAKGFRNPGGARTVEMPASRIAGEAAAAAEVVATVQCLKPCAQLVALPPQCRSNPRMAVRCTAVTASGPSRLLRATKQSQIYVFEQPFRLTGMAVFSFYL